MLLSVENFLLVLKEPSHLSVLLAHCPSSNDSVPDGNTGEIKAARELSTEVMTSQKTIFGILKF